MKLLRLLTVVVLLLVAIVCVVPAFLDPGWRAESRVVIAATPAQVFPYLRDLEKWEEWSLFGGADTGGSMTVSGPGGSVGGQLTWESSSSNGTLTVTELEADHRLTYATTMEGGMGESTGSVTLEAQDGQTLVTWIDEGGFIVEGERLEGGVQGYFGRLFSAAMSAMLTSGNQYNLDSMKSLIEGEK